MGPRFLAAQQSGPEKEESLVLARWVTRWRVGGCCLSPLLSAEDGAEGGLRQPGCFPHTPELARPSSLSDDGILPSSLSQVHG